VNRYWSLPVIRLLPVLLALAVLTACTPTTTVTFPENYTAATCFTGQYAFDLEVSVPPEYGRVLALTQHARGSDGLRSVCGLVVEDDPLPGDSYPIYSGEVDEGRDGICVSARTANAGHVLSCAPAAEVRRAMNAPLGTEAARVRLARWQAYGGS
jgi:hypothetical protein